MTEYQPGFPLQEFLGFTIENRDGVSIASVELDERHLNPFAMTHGAVPFALMDTAMGAAVVAVVPAGKMCATIEMHTRFHRGVPTGRLHATAEVISAGRKVIHLSARTVDDDDRLVASATSSFAVIELPA